MTEFKISTQVKPNHVGEDSWGQSLDYRVYRSVIASETWESGDCILVEVRWIGSAINYLPMQYDVRDLDVISK